MKRINCLLDGLRDETGVMNPTRYRLTDEGRSLIYVTSQVSKLPIQFIVEHLPLEMRFSVVLPHKRLDNISEFEMQYIYETVMKSPYHLRCEVRKVYDEATRTTTTIIREGRNVMEAYYHPYQRSWKWFHLRPEDAIDLAPGGVYWQKQGKLLKVERERRRKVRQLRRTGLASYLEAQGIGQWGFRLRFQEYTQAPGYTIHVYDAGPSGHAPTGTRATVYEGTDRALFLRAFDDAISAYFSQATDLEHEVRKLSYEQWQSVQIDVNCRKLNNFKIRVKEPMTSWLQEAKQHAEAG